MENRNIISEDRNNSSRVISTEAPLGMFKFLKQKSKKQDITVSQLLRLAVRKTWPGAAE